MWWRSRKVWAAGLGLWALALLLPRPGGHPAGTAHWPPRSFCVYYGRWDSAHIALAHKYELIIAHPGKKLEAFNADLVSRLRSGADGLPGNADDSLVLAYISLGEDEDPPPGPVAMPARYLDRKRLILRDGFFEMGADGLPQEVEGSDGIPDRNGAWGSYYVHPMDPEWRKMLEERLEQLARRGVDGFFLDTVDVAPDLQSEMVELIEALHAHYPKLRWVSNRGVGLFQKEPARMRACLDAVVLESWFTRWNWTWGRAVPAPDRAENERLMPVLEGVTRLYLDYLDPEQPDRGSLLALRAGHEPGFWTHPFLDRLGDRPMVTPTPVGPPMELSIRRVQDGRVIPNHPCSAVAVSPRGEFALPGESGPWAVGDARQLRLRPYTSAEVTVDLPAQDREWTSDWKVTEQEDSLRIQWPGQEPAVVWVGETPEQIHPWPADRYQTEYVGVGGLVQDRLYWVSLSKPGGAPDRARPVRPHDLTPPPSPEQVAVRRHSPYLTVSWAPVKATDLAGYRVYINRKGGPLTIPYTRVAGETNLEITVPPEALEVRVTSFDTGNHESQPLRMAFSPPK